VKNTSEPCNENRRAAATDVQSESKSTQGSSAGYQAASVAQRQLAALAQGGDRSGLPGELKAGVERLSGLSMDGVRVHYNSSKPASLNALAFTQGTQIHLGPGHERHLPHEAWHVVQQMQGRVAATLQLKGVAINDAPALEREADVMGARAARGSGAAQHAPSVRSAGAPPPVVQRLISSAEFERLTGQTVKKRRYRLETPATRANKKAASKARAEKNTKLLDFKLNERRLVVESFKIHDDPTALGASGNASGIAIALKTYEADRAPANLVKVYDAIKYWRILNYRELTDYKSGAGGPRARDENEADIAGFDFVLQGMLDEIEAEVRGITGAPLPALKERNVVPVPQFLADVGIAPGYYRDHLAANRPALKLLEQLYDALDDGELAFARLASDSLGALTPALPGLPLIKSMFFSYFADAVSLTDFVDNRLTTAPMTSDEQQALKSYIASSTPFNDAMRAAKPLEQRPPENNRDVVGALNKLPRYNGISYRALTPFPGLDEVWQPGAIISDLAFTSTAASMHGVLNYMYGGAAVVKGSKNYYCMIRGKTAAYITDRSAFQEAEVLFRPGARFRIKAIWQHVAGRVPANAPIEAQMILHRVGSHTVTATGETADAWARMDRADVAKRVFDPTLPQRGAFAAQALSATKVFDMEEV
jgi:hypothetical protein